MKKIIVLAGSMQQFENYLDENGLTDSEAVYGFEPEIIYQIEASRVETVGTFFERKDASELYRLAQSRIR